MLLHEYQFSGCFSKYIVELIEQKHNSGYAYDSAKYRLIQFDKFCIEQNIATPLVTKVPYVMTDEEISAFMKVADEYVPQAHTGCSCILAAEYRVLFRFIYCCGLRVSEARMLKIEDVDFDRCTAILRHSKGDKDRMIYLARDVACMCQDLIDVLRKKHNQYSDLLFPSSDPQKPLQASAINQKFRAFWNKTPCVKSDRHPTVHSLRYSFVVARMNRWMENGEKLNALMPYLSKYLGHSSAENTYYYYHQIESAFKIVRQKDDISTNIIPEVSYEE